MRIRMKTIAAITAITLASTSLTACDGGNGKMRSAEDLANKTAELFMAGDIKGLNQLSMEKIKSPVKPTTPVNKASAQMGDSNDQYADAIINYTIDGVSSSAAIQMTLADDGWKLENLDNLMVDAPGGDFTFNGKTPKRLLIGTYKVGYDNGWLTGEWEQPMTGSTYLNASDATKNHEMTVTDAVLTDTTVKNVASESLQNAIIPCDLLTDALGQPSRIDVAAPEYHFPLACSNLGLWSLDDLTVTSYEPTAKDGVANVTVSLTLTAPSAVFQTYPQGTSYLDFPEDGWTCETVTGGNGAEECALLSMQQKTVENIPIELWTNGNGASLSDEARRMISDALFENVVPAD